MKYYCMWHPKLKWGPGVKGPVLHEHKRDVVVVTGLTLARIRELGWQWIEVEVKVPE